MNQPRIHVIIPAYNEEERIGRTLARMYEYFEQVDYSYEVTVVSDGSTDSTVKLVNEFGKTHPHFHLLESQPNKGKGFVVRKGMLECQGDWLLLSDADLATPIEEVEKLWKYAEQDIPIIIGSRPLKESNLEIRQPKWREMLGRAFNKAVQIMAIRGIQDTQCGFKLFKNDTAKLIFEKCTLPGFGYDFECLMIGRDLGIKIAEVPIRWSHQEGSKVRVLRDGTRMLRDLVILRMKGRRGRIQ